MRLNKQKLYDLMNKTTIMFHSFRGVDDPENGIVIKSNYETTIEIHQLLKNFNGKIFYENLHNKSFRTTFVFDDYVDNLLFRYELYQLNIPYMTTGYSTSTHIVLDA